MPLPFILVGAALLASGYGVKKGVDGYKSKSEADEIIDRAKKRYDEKKNLLEAQEKKTLDELERLGRLELEIGASFAQFSTLADELLQKLNHGRQEKLSIKLPRHKLKKIEDYKFTALGVLGSVAGASVAGVAAGFAVYGGVMTLAAASTGTAISALSGAAATNATLAAIGGGALSAGGLGMAGGTMILGAAVAAPVLAIAGWAYASHGEEALRNANKASSEVDEAIKKLVISSTILEKTEAYAVRIYGVLAEIFVFFNRYFDQLKRISLSIEEAKNLGLDPGAELEKMSDEIMLGVQNGYVLAAILTDIITVPLFKIKSIDENIQADTAAATDFEKDEDGSLIINAEKIDEVIEVGCNELQPFRAF